MTFQLPTQEVISEILINQQPSTPLDLSEVTDADGAALSEGEARTQINTILGESGPLPALTFPLIQELIAQDSPISNARINTIVRDGVVAGQMIEVRLYGAGSLDKYEAVAQLKEQLEPWMSVLSHPVFGLGKTTLSDRIDKELKGKTGRPKGGVYLQLSWAFEFVAHSELFDYTPKTQAQSTSAQTQSQPQTQASSGNREF